MHRPRTLLLPFLRLDIAHLCAKYLRRAPTQDVGVHYILSERHEQGVELLFSDGAALGGAVVRMVAAA